MRRVQSVLLNSIENYHNSFVNCENDELSSFQPFIEMCHQLHKIDFSADAKKEKNTKNGSLQINRKYENHSQAYWFLFFHIINSSTT